MLGASVILVLGLLIYGGILFLFVLLVMALLKYLRTKNTAPEERLLRRSLGEVIKAHRESCKMTQEFVAESLGVSRQAVSKWETGVSHKMCIRDSFQSLHIVLEESEFLLSLLFCGA